MVEVGGWRERKGETKNERATVKPEHRSLKSVDNTLYIILYRGAGGGGGGRYSLYISGINYQLLVLCKKEGKIRQILF